MPESSPAIGHRTLRKGRVSQPFGIYHVTTVVAGRVPLFAGHHAAHAACRCLRTGEMPGGSHLLAWVLMPDHAHCLLQLGERECLQKTVWRLKSVIAHRVNLAVGRRGRLWQPAFHDRALRCEDEIRQVARYIVSDPLRTGLVRCIGDYPYWDAVWVGAP